MYQETLAQVREAEHKHSRLWTECQRCQGSLQRDVLCSKCVAARGAGACVPVCLRLRELASDALPLLATPVSSCSRDCPIFYMRQKVKLDLGDANKKLDRFAATMDW